MAGNRCESCGKMASLDLGEPSVDSLDVSDTGEVTADVSLELTTACCGMTAKTGNFRFEFTPDEVAAHLDTAREAGEVDAGDELIGHDLTVEEESAEADDYYQTKDRHGKVIKAMRYQKHMYQVTLAGTVKCSCGEEFDFSESEELAGSEFDEY